tara:strand:- start:4692 stop:6536 length:1845 start_codon:yes stop_codon:yes gene_type:complete
MKNIFKVTEEEKNRIIGLHLNESRDKRLSSVLNEQEKTDNNFDNPMEIGGTPPESQAKVMGGRVCDLRTCNGGSSYGNFCSPNTSIQKGDVFKVTQHGFSNQVGRVYFVRETMGNCNSSTNGVATQISSLNSQACGNCCDDSPGGNGWKQYSSQAGGWCWGNNGSGPSSFPCGGGPQTYSCNGSTCNPSGSIGQYSSMAACQADCPPPMRYSCKPPYGNNGCIQDPNGQYATLSDCQDDCTPSITYDCGIQGSCIPVQGGGGQYMTMADCTQECKYEGNWRCKSYDQEPQAMVRPKTGSGRELNEQIPTSGHHCIKSLNGPFTSKFQCEEQCPGDGVGKTNCINCVEGTMTNSLPGQKECPPGFSPVNNLSQGPCTECDQQSGCVNVGWGYGQGLFNSMAECQASNCQPGTTEHECINGQCVQQNGGQFANAAACQTSGCGTQLMWECDNGPNGCTQTPNGTFNSQAQCETACCVDFVNGYGWATNHPNATSAQACNRIYNRFGQLGSFNPNTLPFINSCEYDYLINIAGVCGVNANYQNLITGFIGGNNGCYGNPNAQNQGYGQGNPHQNSVCGKVEQFCLAPVGNNPGPSTPTEWYKCQWTQQMASSNGCIC